MKLLHTKKINICMNVLIFLLLPYYAVTTKGLLFFCCFLWATLHEIAHMEAAYLLKGSVHTIRFHLIGLSAEIEMSRLGRAKRCVVLLAGVSFNCVIAGVFLLISRYVFENMFIRYSIYVNLYMVFFNMLPIVPLDGSRLLYELIASSNGYRMAEKIINGISMTVLGFIFLCGIVVFVMDQSNFAVLVLAVFLITMQQTMKIQFAMDRIKNLLYKKERMKKKNIYEVRTLMTASDTTLKSIAKAMDFEQYHLVAVTDAKERVVGFLSEQEITKYIEEGEGKNPVGNILHK